MGQRVNSHFGNKMGIECIIFNTDSCSAPEMASAKAFDWGGWTYTRYILKNHKTAYASPIKKIFIKKFYYPGKNLLEQVFLFEFP